MGIGLSGPSAPPIEAEDSLCPWALLNGYSCCHIKGNIYLHNKTKGQFHPCKKELERSGFNFIKGAPKPAEDQKAIYRNVVCKFLLPRPEFQNIRVWRKRVLPEYLLTCQKMAFPSCRMSRTTYTPTVCHKLYLPSLISIPTLQDNIHIL